MLTWCDSIPLPSSRVCIRKYVRLEQAAEPVLTFTVGPDPRVCFCTGRGEMRGEEGTPGAESVTGWSTADTATGRPQGRQRVKHSHPPAETAVLSWMLKYELSVKLADYQTSSEMSRAVRYT